jgi:hypothetical protein
MSGTENSSTGTTLDDRLRLGVGFAAADRLRILAALSALAPHLSGWEHDQVELEVSEGHRGPGPEGHPASLASRTGAPRGDLPRARPQFCPRRGAKRPDPPDRGREVAARTPQGPQDALSHELTGPDEEWIAALRAGVRADIRRGWPVTGPQPRVRRGLVGISRRAGRSVRRACAVVRAAHMACGRSHASAGRMRKHDLPAASPAPGRGSAAGRAGRVRRNTARASRPYRLPACIKHSSG